MTKVRSPPDLLHHVKLIRRIEFSGTLLGFDDFVSKFGCEHFIPIDEADLLSDMVLEDVTE